MFFWHSSYGYAGTLNDKTIFDLSPFQECLLDGSFEEREHRSGVVLFKIADEEFNKMFVLVDGIYMNYAHFVKGIKLPVSNEETKYTQWQESARKDIERAFGTLKILWKFVSRPIETWNLSDIANQITTALILHNVVVSDRVMGDVNRRYNPAESAEDFGDFGILPQLNATIHNEANEVDEHNNINNEVPQSVIDVVNVSRR